MATPKLGLELLVIGQGNKEATVNQSLAVLDALFSRIVLDKDLTGDPSLPVNGSVYIVANTGTATGLWVGQEKKLAIWLEEALSWFYVTAPAGWKVFVADENRTYTSNVTLWVPAHGYEAMSAEDGLTASVTQTQVGALGLTAQCSRITTCATLGNSVRIGQAAVPGAYQEVMNSGAQSAWIWPATGDAIDAAAANARDATALAAAGVRRYRCFTAGTWRTV